MRDWVIPLLRAKGDRKISSEEFEKDLQVPVFIYRRLADIFDHNFYRSERLKTLFGQTLACLDQASFLKLATMRFLYFHNADRLGHCMAMHPSLEAGQSFILVIFSGLDSLSDSCVVGVFAHELSHLALDHCDKASPLGLNLELEEEANEMVRAWGLGFELDKIQEHLKNQNKGGN